MKTEIIPGDPTPMIRITEDSVVDNHVDLQPDELLDLQRQLMQASYRIHRMEQAKFEGCSTYST